MFDGFAGTGAVGIEALSRGAAHVTFVDNDRRATTLIDQNLAACGAEAPDYTIQTGDTVAALRKWSGPPFDVIWLDPPYDLAGIAAVLEAAAGKLAIGGFVVLERATRLDPDVPGSLVRVRDVKSGDSTLTFFTCP